MQNVFNAIAAVGITFGPLFMTDTWIARESLRHIGALMLMCGLMITFRTLQSQVKEIEALKIALAERNATSIHKG